MSGEVTTEGQEFGAGVPGAEAGQSARYASNPPKSDHSTAFDIAPGADISHGHDRGVLDQEAPVHEIGLIPISSGVNKYVGPSSGFGVAKLVFAKAKVAESADAQRSTNSAETHWATKSQSTFAVVPTAIPQRVEEALQLSKTFFEHVHYQHPFLHQPSHVRLVHNLYSGHSQSAIDSFQVTMVLAISAVILSRRLRIPYSGEGLCATAMQQIDEIDFQNSLQGVECLLLVQIFASYSPFLGVNPWYLNYQCLAAVLDLGLQRDLPTSSSCSAFEREMRTRTFWTIYSLDRIMATKLGRPIGLRDEACELRMPAELEDNDLHEGRQTATLQTSSSPGAMACARVLFKLALLNSEIKYIMHSISRDVPRYTYPQVPDIGAWQSDVYNRLRALHAEMPVLEADDAHMSTNCDIRYHEIAMLLFRPSPRFRKPSRDALLQCQQSAETQIGLFKRLYDADRLPFSWFDIHSICLSATTLLYCVWSEPAIAAATRIDGLIDSTRAASNILSAAGEHWTEARRSRDNLEALSSATVRWLLDLHTKSRPLNGMSQLQQPSGASNPKQNRSGIAEYSQLPDLGNATFDWDLPGVDTYLNNDNLATFVGAPDPFTADFNLTIDGMFSEYQPTFDFGI
ncbi:uncharacterized protein HMPREF1541_01701 [Cyphellophora europaea CBS 101466]|uniref:Xylanolytic transcriptional activator regulatory domain-containing protein n=1 Tax=Cyphellophora europaea (strain CBS 101466) TaxID=1220924 RepID=W2S3M6_CYPE1|nr:uncharacterized protein HMPREF1541_01701 [Cyphellophora europaea CBS 101466]ETN42544.1 hypothetical protein HMPREF1541_01701 [Cyphellophora europaea CBS 101466]